MIIITIDTGTTNTRVCAWQDGTLLAEAARSAGVRDTAITGSTATLMQGVSDAVQEVKQKAGILCDAKVIYLSAGMITSNVGLCEIPPPCRSSRIKRTGGGHDSRASARD
ncbi:2-dehydro-3-deoxygalactonokinase [Citrobacter amalonaticus]|nr:2-dehydro-3-deoxygalactonokinase [Citrobacter amalonaticus]